MIGFISLHELKAQVSSSDHLSSVRPSVCTLFHIFIFFSRITGHLDTKHSWVKILKEPRPFPRGDNNEIAKKFIDEIQKATSQEPLSLCLPNWHKAYFGEGDSNFFK